MRWLGAVRVVLIWSDIVRSTSWGPAVFEVAPAHRQAVRDWIAGQRLPYAAQRDVHAPSVEGWAVLDGGITVVSGFGLTSLPYGLRVLGFGALRLLLADLGAEAPAEPFPHEVPVGLAELRRRHRAAVPDSPDALERAELLATCRDAVLLRWVARTLFEEAIARPAGPPGRPPEAAADTEPGLPPAAVGDRADPAAALPSVAGERAAAGAPGR